MTFQVREDLLRPPKARIDVQDQRYRLVAQLRLEDDRRRMIQIAARTRDVMREFLARATGQDRSAVRFDHGVVSVSFAQADDGRADRD